MRPWWRDSDMLYVGYRSHSASIVGVANRLRTALADYYPKLPNSVLEARDCRLRENTPYKELVIVGHSLGGVVVRWALLEMAREWMKALRDDPGAERPRLLDARQILFSPAIGGVRPAGPLALVEGFDPGAFIKTLLSTSPAYGELTKGTLLRDVRTETEQLYDRDPAQLSALGASILWAEPDRVVAPIRYSSDNSHSEDGTSHKSVCKPSAKYPTPWQFVETGRPR
jgi:alpha-beta hydrolase superfamily lysophospholipase